MTIAVGVSTLALGLTGWKSVGGQLLTSGVFLLNSHQDMRLRARVAATFSVFITTAFGISALVTAIQVNLSHAAAICAVVLSSETLLILRWWLRRTSA